MNQDTYIAGNIQKALRNALEILSIEVQEINLEHPAEITNGDFSTNAALMYAKKAGMNPRELAEKIVAELSKQGLDNIEKVQIAGPGFINFFLMPEFFAKSVGEILIHEKELGRNTILSGKKVMFEYTDPNPFKPFHIGHLMTNAIGESLSRIFEWSGATVLRANYQGDVGPHVAKAIYALMKKEIPAGLNTPNEKAAYIGECYAIGAQTYEEDGEVKKEIDAINKKIYERSDAKINEMYDWGRAATLEAFEDIYKMLGTAFDYYFFESDMAKVGEKIVKENLSSVFEESDGAIVFKAEQHDPKLHTRVFINSQGLPTYETKELGLTKTKFEKDGLDLSVVTTAVEQAEYMKVVEKALSIIYPEMAQKMKHLTHGMMRFASGKMSSRKGNVITGESLLRDAKAMIEEKIKDRDFSDGEKAHLSEKVGVAALKYSILRQATQGDILYDFEKSISFEGDSGPYLQYTYTRIQSLLAKAEGEHVVPNTTLPAEWNPTETEKLLYRFPEVVEKALEGYAPHTIASYLIELARAFSAFYGNTKIIDKEDSASSYKLAIAVAVGLIMKQGLYLLGIDTPKKM